MALSSSRLTSAMKDKLIEYMGTPEDGGTKLEKMAQAIAETVLDEIKNYAQVSSTVTVTSVSGVTTGPGISGPGAGTATGTIS